jgi:hypothetical protein
MIKFEIRYEGDKIKGTVPSSWEELTVKQWAALRPENRDLEIVSILSGIDLEILENTKGDLSPVVEMVYKALADMPSDLKDLPRQAITIMGKRVAFPKNLDFTRYGQKALTKNLLRDAEDMRAIIADVFAIYAQPSIDGKFDSNNLEPIKKAIEAMPIIQVLPWVIFFLKRLRRLKINLLIASDPFLYQLIK